MIFERRNRNHVALPDFNTLRPHNIKRKCVVNKKAYIQYLFNGLCFLGLLALARFEYYLIAPLIIETDKDKGLFRMFRR